jgi:hypothetical protein
MDNETISTKDIKNNAEIPNAGVKERGNLGET